MRSLCSAGTEAENRGEPDRTMRETVIVSSRGEAWDSTSVREYFSNRDTVQSIKLPSSPFITNQLAEAQDGSFGTGN